MSDIEKRCGNCRRFVADGKRNADGERTGWCAEIYGAPTRESNVCYPSVTFRPKATPSASSSTIQSSPSSTSVTQP